MAHWLTREEGPMDFILSGLFYAHESTKREVPTEEDVLREAVDRYPIDHDTAQEAFDECLQDGFIELRDFEGRYRYVERVGQA